ncbi:MAG: ABC transporter permease [Bordetella sp. SCN 67-23]|nr:branched-chain amino acid ABC transporter permease [Burkholderiales bacterium]ODS74038.1 MAG: ABC transporter permease [Bordetella sp. SCN 67-23]ODU87349.1 MAG: ABC transporter permease [Bordetella sp. SCN 68-11]OJW85966.1 MAG: branched-chain amino acid ABC transporter permease [Burkholderiales bacterium 67-32]
MTLFLEQTLNGVQLGLLLFLMAAGLTLIFGIMNFMNLAHGSLFMAGAYLATSLIAWTGSFAAGLALAVAATTVLGLALEQSVLKPFFGRHHLDQVLATFALILIANDAVRMIWGDSGLTIAVPAALAGHVTLFGEVSYPVYRCFIIALGLAVAAILYAVIQHTRVGMIVRAGASDRETASALGANVPLLFAAVFGFGAALAGLAGIVAAPILTVQSGMGDDILILALVLVVIGGIGSIRGAFVAALLVGLVDSLGRSYFPALLRVFLDPATASSISSALSAMLVYVLLALVLLLRPGGLLPVGGRA